MLKSTISLALLYASLACTNQMVVNENKATDVPYTTFIETLQAEKRTAMAQKDRFFEFITNDIPAYWTGTLWDFNGTTRIPKSGTIACGYFVTNVLTDFGFDIKRVYLAQQASSVMIKQLSAAGSVKYFSDSKKLITFLKARSEQEIYLVGLDFHTGFVIRDKDKFYFLHSSYIDKSGVMKEEIELSNAFLSSKSFMIGSISANEENFK
jgi:hypothetical protein